MGLAILAVGATAIVALQRYAVLGTMTSRHVTNATNVGAGVLEKMETEAGNWTDNTASITAGTAAGVTGDPSATETMPWLALALTTPGTWVAPDWHGYQLDGTVVQTSASADTDPVAYCTHVRATYIGDPANVTAGNKDTADSVRIEVRTFWSKAGTGIASECREWTGTVVDDLFHDTDQPTASPAIVHNRAEYGVIFLATIVRRNSL